METAAVLTCAELEISLKWAEENPALLDSSLKEFFKQYGQHYIFSLKATSGFVTLVANLQSTQPQ